MMPLKLFRSSPIKEYQRYRQVGRDLNHKIIRAFVDHAVIDRAARALGLGKNRQLFLDDEDELDVLMDFSLYEVKQLKKTPIERYREEKGGSNQIEQELLNAMLAAQTGLFRVEDVLSEQYNVVLHSLVGSARRIILTDINFSQTMATGIVVFLRPIVLAHFTMTSGVTFGFPTDMEQELTRKWLKKWEETRSAVRYAQFFKLSKHRGIDMMYV
jgi:hypothetical protein